MTGTRTRFNYIVQQLGVCITIAAALSVNIRSAYSEVVVFDGFGDADRNNDGLITSYDTDINNSGTFNQYTGTPPSATGPDSDLANRGIVEVTAAENPSDVGIVWSGIRSYDSLTNADKSRLRIINDNVATGVETTSNILNSGLALGVESRGGGSSFIGKFNQPVVLGTQAGAKVVASFDWRVWRESGNNDTQPSTSNNSFRWGLYQDTDNEFGQTAGYGDGWFNNGGNVDPNSQNGATVMWGRDDGKWFNSAPGAEGDKGISTETQFGDFAPTTNTRIRWESNVAGLNGDNGRILEGTGDTSTIATPPGNGNGGNLTASEPHSLKLEIVRLANGLVEVATFVDNIELLRDSIKETDTNYSFLQPVPFTYNYIAFRNGGTATVDFDYVIDNVRVETFSAGVQGDYNNDGTVNAADYVVWRKGTGVLANEVADPGTFSAADYTEWRARFGNPAGSGASLDGSAIPEPGTISGLIFGSITLWGLGRRRVA